ncbi:MAG: M1 family metallopeptidase [Clostridia bacterium]|nr:M1 family metallopeptidase [Clostridia bacterium]
MRTRKILIAAAAALLLAVVILGLAFDRALELPEASPELVQASSGLDEIAIDARLHPDERMLTVRQTLRLVNRTGQDQNAAVLRTWPNAFQNMDTSPCTFEEKLYDLFYPDGFSSGALVMKSAHAAGQAVLHRYTDAAKTVMAVPVPGGWKVGETAEIELEYTVQIPRMAYRFGVWDGIWTLGNAFAIPAVWEDGAFRTDAYAPVGDPFVSDCANYSVSVAVPEGYVCAGSGWAETEKAKDETIYRFSAPAVRDFALVISDRFASAQALEGNVLVAAFAEDASGARQLLRYARKAIGVYESLWGEYPYQSFTLAQMHMPLGGMEYPALAMISADVLSQGGRELEYLIAHEAAHQWWYALAGSDGWNQPWQDEALCEFGVLEYARSVYGAQERADLEQTRVESAMRVTVSQGVTPGAPLDRFSSMSEYSLVVYNRGAAYLCALNRMLPQGLNPFLREYAQRYAFSRASRGDFESLLTAFTGEDLSPLTRDYLDTTILN